MGAVQKARCGAKARSAGGRPCRQPPMANGRCRYHGGLSTGPRTLRAGGRYSKGLGQLAARMDELLEVDDLLDLGQGLALLDLAANLRIERGLEQRDTPLFREEALSRLKAFRSAAAADGSQLHSGAVAALTRLELLLEEGATADQALAEGADIVESRQKRTEAALKIQAQQQGSITIQQFRSYLALMAETIREHVPADYPAILAALRVRLAGRGGAAGGGAGGFIEAGAAAGKDRVPG